VAFPPCESVQNKTTFLNHVPYRSPSNLVPILLASSLTSSVFGNPYVVPICSSRMFSPQNLFPPHLSFLSLIIASFVVPFCERRAVYACWLFGFFFSRFTRHEFFLLLFLSFLGNTSSLSLFSLSLVVVLVAPLDYFNFPPP